jgi:hypothetical protein
VWKSRQPTTGAAARLDRPAHPVPRDLRLVRLMHPEADLVRQPRHPLNHDAAHVIDAAAVEGELMPERNSLHTPDE